jgi:hypothetical protein
LLPVEVAAADRNFQHTMQAVAVVAVAFVLELLLLDRAVTQ